MEFLTGVKQKEVLEIGDLLLPEMVGREVKVNGAVHAIRDMGTIAFVILRKREGLVQCVYEPGKADFSLKELREGGAVEVSGFLAASEKAPGGVEIRMRAVVILSEPVQAMPIPISKWKMNISLETSLDLRPVSLRNIRERAKFRIQDGIVRGFRDFLVTQGFTEIHTPKIGARGAEGGANIFRLDYFHRPAVLAQSPQFYKQMMVGVFDRVFETAPVFRAEKHNTKRHLNEYTSLDFEMGYIDGFEDIMDMETGALQNIMGLLKREYGRLIRNPYDLEPEEESLIGRYFKEEYGSDFVFVTHYPSKKRPFYAMDDPGDPAFTLSFDCLFKGMEITTGGQRIHDYHMLLEKMAKRGMTEEGMEHYLMAFKYGMPPHGGLGIGLERLTMKLVGEDNVRETTLFPRDLSRLEP